jgi:hypothetical protein
MVKGLDSFISYFKGMESSFVIIGGTACDIWCTERGISARATKDIDMVLIIESLDRSFTSRFLTYIREKGYSHIVKGTDKHEFYRFERPADPDAPGMIELFSRRPALPDLPSDIRVIPVGPDSGILSLSAFLMDDAYYAFVRENTVLSGGVPCVAVPALVVLKMKAWLDLSARKQSGDRLDDKDVKKHKNDVFRLALISQESDRIALPQSLQSDVDQFLGNIKAEPPDMRALSKNAGVPYVPNEDALQALHGILGLELRI